MKDKWMNVGYEEDELKPYLEPEPDYKDLKRIGKLRPVATLSCMQIIIINFYFNSPPVD
jgi:MAP/microtubule affinity-regulating kinase